MAEVWNDKIDRSVDWGGCEATNGLPVAGSVVQDFIKSELNSKVGYIYHDTIGSQYLCFATEEDKDAYLKDTSKTELIIGSMVAPSSYVAKIKVDSYYNAVLIGQKENYLNFTYDITNNDESFPDNIRYTITVTKNGKTSTLNGTGIYGKPVSINIDEFLTTEGTTEFAVSITGQTTNVTGAAVITYEVVNLVFTSDYDISQVYDLTADIVDPLVINYSIFGSSNVKYIDWYIDGKLNSTDTIQGGTAEAVIDNKRFSVAGLEHGVHNVQFMAYVIVNGENFYTDTLYREFFVISDKSNKAPMIAYETSIPKAFGVISELKTYGAVQYEPYTLTYAVYNPNNLDVIPVQIYVDDELMQTVSAPNFKELEYTYTPSTAGAKTFKFVAEDTIKQISTDVEETPMDLQEITNSLILNLSSIGRTNEDANKDEWTYGEYSTSFEGFNWSSVSGWSNNRLVLSDGMTATINVKPLAQTAYGKTIEIEFETINVSNDDAVICDVRNSDGIGMLITASKASLTVGTGEKQSVSTNYKANENVRIAFVMDSINQLALIYVNGIVSGAVATADITVNVDRYLSFVGTSEAGIKVKQIRIYDTQLSSEQILNNYILYRDSVSEMIELYNSNDVLDGQVMSIEKISDYLPVILLTGEEIFWLESQKDTDIEIKIDVEYINKQNPEYQFRWTGGCCRIQGTSSAGYVRKNWRLYSKRKERYVADVYDWQGNLINDKKRRIAFKPGAIPVNCWTLKADYAESSSTHNTGVATLWNEVMTNAHHSTNGFVCRTEAQKAALENGYEYDVRTTVDGFPIVVFARRNETEAYTFMGKYNFNNDKSTENVFGFCDIPGFDDKFVAGHEGEIIPEGEFNAGKDYTYGNKMQCWEMCENYDTYALFKTTEGWDDAQIDETTGLERVDEDGVIIKNWASGFEARYPDDANEADTSDLKAFANWLIGCGDDHEKFAKEKYDHFDLWKIAAYYVYLMRFGAVDQVVKNSMFTSEDGHHWYYINYDNDTILGLDNSGTLTYPPTITRETKSGSAYAYAGHESRLWNMLEADTEFMTYYVPEVDNALFGGGLTYANTLKYFNENQSDKWCERIYNSDAEYKYIKPYAAGTVNTLFMMHGSRKAHRTWWLAKRFQLMDAKFSNDNYEEKYVRLLLDGSPGAKFTIKASDYMYFGCKYNKNPLAMGVELNKGDYYTFNKPSTDEDPVNGKDFAMGDPLYIYSPLYIEELDLSPVSKYIYALEFGRLVDDVIGAKMKKLIIGGEKTAKTITTLAGIEVLTNLEYLDLTGVNYPTVDFSTLTLLKTLLAGNSTITQFKLADGCVIDTLVLPESANLISFNNLPNLTWNGITGFENHIASVSISGTPALSNNFTQFYNWALKSKKDDVLNLSGFEWDECATQSLIDFGSVLEKGVKLNLRGKVILATDPTTEQVARLQELFGDDCFTNGAAFWIVAPESVFVHGPSTIVAGKSGDYTTTIFSENPGTVEWTIENGGEFGYVESTSTRTGRLTTYEDENSDHDITIKAIHWLSNGEDSSIRLFDVHVNKTIYPTFGTIKGDATISEDRDYVLELGPNGNNGDYTVTWSLPSEYVSISNSDNKTCHVSYDKKTIFELNTLTAEVVNKNGTSFTVELTVTITDASVLMTSTSNPELMRLCYDLGWASLPDVMYRSEAQVVSDLQFKNAVGKFNEYNVTSFKEFEEFTGITTIPSQTFYQSNISEIVLPSKVTSIGSFALAAMPVKEIHIPSSVVSIAYNAFNNSPISKFTVGAGSVVYAAYDDALVNITTGELIKYPEGNLREEYTTSPIITSIGTWAIRNTKLRTLTLHNNVVKLSNNAIYSNTSLIELNLGSGLQVSSLEQGWSANLLLNINVSEHESLYSVDGVVYSIDKTILYKYPEGRNYISIVNGTNTIGNYAFASCTNITSEIEIPGSITSIGGHGLYNCNKIKGVTFSEDSKLISIGEYAFQLCSSMTKIRFTSKLETINQYAFANCPKLGIIYFNGDAPLFIDNETPTTVFGKDAGQLTGKDVTGDRIVYVPASAEGYDEERWNESIFNPERNNFELIQL